MTLEVGWAPIRCIIWHSLIWARAKVYKQAKCGVWTGGGWIRQISSAEFLRNAAANQQDQGFCWKLPARKSQFQA